MSGPVVTLAPDRYSGRKLGKYEIVCLLNVARPNSPAGAPLWDKLVPYVEGGGVVVRTRLRRIASRAIFYLPACVRNEAGGAGPGGFVSNRSLIQKR